MQIILLGQLLEYEKYNIGNFNSTLNESNLEATMELSRRQLRVNENNFRLFKRYFVSVEKSLPTIQYKSLPPSILLFSPLLLIVSYPLKLPSLLA